MAGHIFLAEAIVMPDWLMAIDLHGLTVDQAVEQAEIAVYDAREQPRRFKAIKFIHANGEGPRIISALRDRLDLLLSVGMITMWLTGNEWNIYNFWLRKRLATVQSTGGGFSLAADPDYNRDNPGITVAAWRAA